MATQPKHDRARIEVVPALVDRTGEPTSGSKGQNLHMAYWRRARATEAHYVRIVAGNGAVLATSELYANKVNAKRAAVALVRAGLQVGFAESHGRKPIVEVGQ